MCDSDVPAPLSPFGLSQPRLKLRGLAVLARVRT